MDRPLGGMIRLAILGSTGSVGRQALRIVDEHPGRFEVVALIAGSDAGSLEDQVERYSPEMAGLAALDQHARFATGSALLVEAASRPDVDVVLNAVVGSRGLAPTLAALKAGTRVALANKESLIAGGPLIRDLLKADPSLLLPVDSEHAALAQCLTGIPRDQIARIRLTASGGPFRGRGRKQLEGVSVAEALDHPTWRMGNRITIDSATLFNKGLELIEACHLFDLTPDRVEAVIHPQSIIHAMVDLVDGSTLMQAAVPDMRIPIAAALLHPEKVPVGVDHVDWADIGELSFEPIDHEAFPAVRLALEAIALGGTAPAIINAADEEAVAAFLDGQIGFLDIMAIVTETLQRVEPEPIEDLSGVSAAERAARETARTLIDKV
ncbi:MAG: 1-deoxy-D-xylulose-5-phosphate reductoisomerase [Actinomycetota bacterium]